jgi:macrolide-specific efflux system membrane fusion protein
LEIIGNFAEADAASIKAGQAATVTFPAISGQTGTGSVAAISPTATTSNSVTTYPVTITLNDYPTTLKLGQTATASITTKSASNVLYLPSNAVIIGSDTSSGTVQLIGSDGKATTQTVGVGVQGDSTVEITSGLKSGDKVLISTDTATGATSGTTSGYGSRSSLGGGGYGGFSSGVGGLSGGSMGRSSGLGSRG